MIINGLWKLQGKTQRRGEGTSLRFFFFLSVDVPEESFYFKVCNISSFTILYFYAGTDNS